MKGIDTNVLLRYLTQDTPKQSRLATRFIEAGCSAKSPGIINHIVLCELIWTLQAVFDRTQNDIINIIENLLAIDQIEIINSDLVHRALADYKKSNAGFADHLLARVNEAHGCKTTVTFDKKAAKHSTFELLK